MRTNHSPRLTLAVVVAVLVAVLTTMLSCDGEAGSAKRATDGVVASSAEAETDSPRSVAARTGDYEFTTDWFSHNIPVWTTVFAPYRGRPGLRYLEIGVYEGRSLLWVLEHVLTDPSCRLTGVDIEISPVLLSNLDRSGRSERVTTIEGPSQVELRKLPPESFDIIYVDGSHTADDVLADAVLSWELLRTGGIIIFDDYQWDGSHHTGGGPLPPELLPGPAIASFLRSYRHEIEVVHSGYQIVVRKQVDPCSEIKGHCSPFGPYVYDWKEHALLRSVDGGETVEVSTGERRLIETILRAGSVGPEIGRDPVYIRMRERLGLDSR